MHLACAGRRPVVLRCFYFPVLVVPVLLDVPVELLPGVLELEGVLDEPAPEVSELPGVPVLPELSEVPPLPDMPELPEVPMSLEGDPVPEPVVEPEEVAPLPLP